MFSQRLSYSNTPVDSFLLGPAEGLWASVMFCWEIATDVKGFRIFHFATSPIIHVPTSRIFKEGKLNQYKNPTVCIQEAYCTREENTFVLEMTLDIMLRVSSKLTIYIKSYARYIQRQQYNVNAIQYSFSYKPILAGGFTVRARAVRIRDRRDDSSKSFSKSS